MVCMARQVSLWVTGELLEIGPLGTRVPHSVTLTLETVSGVRLGHASFGNIMPPAILGDPWTLGADFVDGRTAVFQFIGLAHQAFCCREFVASLIRVGLGWGLLMCTQGHRSHVCPF